MDYNVNIWGGVGYCLHAEKVQADCAQEALERATASIIAKGLTGLYLTYMDAEQWAHEDGCRVDDLEDSGAIIYVDATNEGAPYAVYILGENLEIHKC